MSKTMNREIRKKSRRESYLEQSPYNGSKKRKSLTSLHSYDDSDIAYQSAPEYLKRLMNTSISSNGHSVRSLTRTQSASEMIPGNNSNRTGTSGNPKYKTQEDYYDEIQSLKKELKYTKDDNSNLRAKIRWLEEDSARKCKEIDNLYDTTKNGDLRRTLASSSTPTANVVMNLKQRVFKLELQLKQRETTIDEMKTNPRWTKGTELEIQNRALFNELEKQKLERLTFVQNDYMASIDEETKNAIRKLEAEKRELKIENENFKKKVDESEKLEHDEQLSPRHHARSTDRDLLRKIEDLKEACENYETKLDQMKDDLKQMRRERDKYRDKFDTANEDLEEIKRERDQYGKKFDRRDELRYEHNRHTKVNPTGRSSSSSLKHDEERYLKQSRSPHSFRRNSSSSEELSKKDSRSNTPIRKSNEYIVPRLSSTKLDPNTSLKTSSRHLRRNEWTSDDEKRVKKFREKHAATVIQRGWRKHKKRHRNSFINKTRQDNFDKRNSKIGGMKPSETQSPRGSQQKLGSKMDNFGSGTIKNRPSSASMSNESALKTIQASLRGCINRTELNKTSRTQNLHRIEDDDDLGEMRSRQFGSQYGNERKRESFVNNSNKNLGDIYDKIGSNSRLPTNIRDSTSKVHRSLSPPLDNDRPSSPRIDSSDRSKQNLPNDRNKLNSGNRLPLNEREVPFKPHQSSSPPADIHRSSSPRSGGMGGSKQLLPNDKNKLQSTNRIDRDSFLKLERPSSPPSNDHRLTRRISPENIRPSSRQSNVALRKSPTNSKQSLKNSFNNDDDDDVLDF